MIAFPCVTLVWLTVMRMGHYLEGDFLSYLRSYCINPQLLGTVMVYICVVGVSEFIFGYC